MIKQVKCHGYRPWLYRSSFFYLHVKVIIDIYTLIKIQINGKVTGIQSMNKDDQLGVSSLSIINEIK